MKPRDFVVEDNKPGPVPLLIGLMGAPGSGKTYSALTLAQGMKTEQTGRPVLIDTEKGRSRKYRTSFDFQRIDFQPPFKPSDFLSAVKAAQRCNPCAIIVDSMSDEHEGDGGVLDWHDRELDRRAGDDFGRREQLSQAAWIEPKNDRRTMVSGLLQVLTPLIFCFRAREKTKPVKNDRGKTVPTNIGYQPIAPLEIVHYLDLNMLLPPKSDGHPRWRTDKAAEDFVIKLPEQFKPLFGTGQPLTSEIGSKLARWARGEDATVSADAEAVVRAAKAACEDGRVAWGEFWQAASKAEKVILQPFIPELKAILLKNETDADPLAEQAHAAARDSLERQGG